MGSAVRRPPRDSFVHTECESSPPPPSLRRQFSFSKVLLYDEPLLGIIEWVYGLNLDYY